MKKRFSEEQIVKILREGRETGKVAELCRRHAISDASYTLWYLSKGGAAFEVGVPIKHYTL